MSAFEHDEEVIELIKKSEHWKNWDKLSPGQRQTVIDAATDIVKKGKAVPVGTVRGNMIKTADGWKYNKKGREGKNTSSKENTVEEADEKFGGGEKIVGVEWGGGNTKEDIKDAVKQNSDKLKELTSGVPSKYHAEENEHPEDIAAKISSVRDVISSLGSSEESSKWKEHLEGLKQKHNEAQTRQSKKIDRKVKPGRTSSQD